MTVDSGDLAAGRTEWIGRIAPLHRYLRTETSSALILLLATIAALTWVNVDQGSYVRAWHTELSVHVGSSGVAMDLRSWINSGLMTFFFFVIGLEARRERDVGELRDRSRAILPLLAGLSGMAVAPALYVAINAGHSSVHGWGIAMSTDTAFALGMLAFVGRRAPSRLRSFILTVVVIDDLVALIVIAVAYSEKVRGAPLLVAAVVFAVVLVLARLRVTVGLLYFSLATAAWVATEKSGVDPIVIGLLCGLITWASPAQRSDLERASDLFRGFREQPTSELAAEARAGLRAAVSPNERLQQLYHPWTSYLIVPLFALANAGISINATFLGHALNSPVTLGIIAGYVVGKPVGIIAAAASVVRATGGRLRPPVGWLAVAGAGTSAGIGFTVSLLIATLALDGPTLAEAKLGILIAAVSSAVLTEAIFLGAGRLPHMTRLRLLLGTSDVIIDLTEPVDPQRDHIRGPADAPVTLLEYGDLECPYCGQAEQTVRELLAEIGDLRYVWRHLPLTDVHPHAQLAAEAAEAAGRQGAFWPMHDRLLAEQDDLTGKALVQHAKALGLDVARFTEDLTSHRMAKRVEVDVESADGSGVTGTPTFFVNGQRHVGAYDIETLSAAVKAARARAALGVTA